MLCLSDASQRATSQLGALPHARTHARKTETVPTSSPPSPTLTMLAPLLARPSLGPLFTPARPPFPWPSFHPCLPALPLTFFRAQEALEEKLERYLVRRVPLGQDRHFRRYWWGLAGHRPGVCVEDEEVSGGGDPGADFLWAAGACWA